LQSAEAISVAKGTDTQGFAGAQLQWRLKGSGFAIFRSCLRRDKLVGAKVDSTDGAH
jgi:hypothetical protein